MRFVKVTTKKEGNANFPFFPRKGIINTIVAENTMNNNNSGHIFAPSKNKRIDTIISSTLGIFQPVSP